MKQKSEKAPLPTRNKIGEAIYEEHAFHKQKPMNSQV